MMQMMKELFEIENRGFHLKCIDCFVKEIIIDNNYKGLHRMINFSNRQVYSHESIKGTRRFSVD